VARSESYGSRVGHGGSKCLQKKQRALILFALFPLTAVDAANADVEFALSYKDKKLDPPEISAPPTRRS
jgi:hypothetical protein